MLVQCPGRKKRRRVAQLSARGNREQKEIPVLTLITTAAAESVVEVLASRRLGPLRIRRLLAPTVSAGARRSGVAHRLRTVAGRRLGLRTSEVTLLAAVLTCDDSCQSC